MTEHELLVAARNVLDREGWWGGGMPDPGPGRAPYCAIQATAVADTGGSGRAADVVLMDLLGLGDLMGIAYWNDRPGRTKQEVLDLFDRAIAATAPEPAFDQLDPTPRADASVSTKEEVFS